MIKPKDMEKEDIIQDFYQFLREHKVFGAYMNGFKKNQGSISPKHMHEWFITTSPAYWIFNAFGWGVTYTRQGWSSLSEKWEKRSEKKFGNIRTHLL